MGHVTLPTLPSGQFNLSLASSCHDPPPHQTGSVSLPVPGIGGGHKCHLTVPTPPQGAFYLSLARTCHSPSTNKIWSVSLHPFERCGCPKFKKVGHCGHTIVEVMGWQGELSSAINFYLNCLFFVMLSLNLVKLGMNDMRARR